MTRPPEPVTLVDEMLEAIEDGLHTSVDLLDPESGSEMIEMISYHLGWRESAPAAGKGKRLRPLLSLLTCQAAGGEWRDCVPVASAVELIHNFTLIHDDIEDQSETRRGRTTVWKRWGVAQAINTGDAVLILAHLSCQRLRQSDISAGTVLEVQRALDEACLRLTVGQYLDLAFETRPDVLEPVYLAMVEGKTAALIASGTLSAALVAGARPPIVEAYREFGRHLGLSFQIQDDILGIWGAPEVTGKPAGDDLRSRKKSLPILFGLHNSKEFASLWNDSALGPDDIQDMTNELERGGALDYARQASEKHMDTAVAALDSARPLQPAADELHRLSINLLGRER